MKVLHINCNYMGTKLHQTMIEHLNKYTNENIIYCPLYKGSNIVTIPNKNVISSRCFNVFDRLLFFNKQKKILNDIITKIDVKDFELIHAYTLFTDGNVAYNLNKKYNIPYCVAIRSTDFDFLKYKPYLKRKGISILLSSSKVFFLSEITRNKFMEKFIPNKIKNKILEKTEIMPNGIDDFWLENINPAKKEINNENIKIICVSQILKRKNIPLIQNAISYLNNKDYHFSLEVIGKNVDKVLTQKISKDKNTSYYNHLTKEELIKHYRKADIFILPSKNETFGLVYAEAMTQNIPVLYSRGEGFDGQFSEGEVGFAINNKDYKELAKQILKCLDNYNSFSNNYLKVEKFKWDIICNKYYNIYKSILNSKKTKSHSFDDNYTSKIKLSFITLISLPKTIYFNIRCFPLSIAIRLPVLVSYNTKLLKLKKNIINIKSDIKPFLIKIGFGGSIPINSNKGMISLEGGTINFFGKASFAEGCSIRNSGILSIGNNFYSNKNSIIWCDNSITIGNDNLFGWNTLLRDSDGHFIIENGKIKNNNAPIVLSDHIWLAANVKVLKGSIIPEDCIVAFGSLITKKFTESNCIYAGIPAQKIKERINWERG